MATLPRNLSDSLPNQPDPAVGAITGPITPGTGATNLGKAEGQVAVAADVGVLGLVVSDVDGKYRWLPVYDNGATPVGVLRGPLVFGWDDVNNVMLPVTLFNSGGAGIVQVLGPGGGPVSVGLDQAGGAITVPGSGIPPSGNAIVVAYGINDTGQPATPNAAGTFGFPYATTLGCQYVTAPFTTRSDTYTVAANGVTVDVTKNPFKFFSIQTVPTGAVTSWTVLLEGSLDGVVFFTILTATNAAPAPSPVASLPWPARFFRSRCSAIVLGGGTNVVTRILGLQ